MDAAASVAVASIGVQRMRAIESACKKSFARNLSKFACQAPKRPK